MRLENEHTVKATRILVFYGIKMLPGVSINETRLQLTRYRVDSLSTFNRSGKFEWMELVLKKGIINSPFYAMD